MRTALLVSAVVLFTLAAVVAVALRRERGCGHDERMAYVPAQGWMCVGCYCRYKSRKATEAVIARRRARARLAGKVL